MTEISQDAKKHNSITSPGSLDREWCDSVKKSGNRKPIPKGLRFDVLNRDGFKCRYCGRAQTEGATLHLDHILAVVSGGKDTIDNLVTACSDCNLGKSAKTIIQQSPPHATNIISQPTYGISFKGDGGCHWQFVIDAMSDHAAQITTFSWLDGTDYSVEHVSRDFLRDRCILFASHAVFLERAEYWGDAFAGRRNLGMATQ